MPLITLVRDGNIEDETWSPVPLMMPAEEESAKVFWILCLVRIGKAIQFILQWQESRSGGLDGCASRVWWGGCGAKRVRKMAQRKGVMTAVSPNTIDSVDTAL